MSNRFIVLPHRHLLRLRGKDARHFLQGLVTQDIHKVTADHTVWTAMLNAQGKYLFDFFVIADGEHDLLLDCDSSQINELRRLLGLYRLRADVAVEDLADSYHVAAAMGDPSTLALPPHPGRSEQFMGGKVIATIDPRCVDIGMRVVAPAGEAETWLVQRGYSRASLADYEAHRIALGLPRTSIDSVAQKTLILENGFEELNGVSFDKGCYVGQEVTARTKHRANLHKRLYVVKARGTLPENGGDILLGERVVGDLRSTCGNTGLAVIRSEAVEKAASGEAALSVAGLPLTARNPQWRKS
jgi:folate-binding protein YgfZ